MDEIQILFMKSQAKAVWDFIQAKRAEGCMLSDNDIVRDWIENHAKEYRETWYKTYM